MVDRFIKKLFDKDLIKSGFLSKAVIKEVLHLCRVKANDKFMSKLMREVPTREGRKGDYNY